MFVKTPAGEIQLQLKQEAPASVLYTEVEQHTGIPASDYKILYQGKWPVSCPIKHVFLVNCHHFYPVLGLPASFSFRPSCGEELNP